MKIQTKVVLTTSIIFIISVAFLGILIFSNSKENLEGQIKNNLFSSSKIIENNINTFLNGQKNKIELIATQDSLSNEELIEMIEKDDSFYDLFVINSNGTVIASSNPNRIGLDRANRPYFTNGINQTYISSVYFALVPEEYSIAVSTPFNNGVLVGSIKVNYLNNFVSDRTGLGETEETLMAFENDKNEVVYFTQRLFSDKKMEIVSEESIKSFPVYNALNEEKSLFSDIRDYRNKEVLASTNYLEELKIGMVTKIDIKEAFEDIEKLRKITIYIIIIIIALISFVIYIIIKPISEEINDLSENINKITRGKLDIQLKKSNLLEIKNLIDSLNRILASMKLAILRTGLGKTDLGIGEIEKAKEDAEEKYKMLFDNSNDSIFIHDLEGHFLEVNETACKKLGYTRTEFLKLSPKKIDSPRYVKLVKSRIEELKKNKSAIFDSAHITKSGKEIPVEISSKVITYQGAPAILSLAREKIKK